MTCTSVIFHGISRLDRNKFNFLAVSDHVQCPFYTEGIEYGVVKVGTTAGVHLNDFARVISGCFLLGSNFIRELKYAYGDIVYSIKAVELQFNGITVMVDEKNATEEAICKEWQRKWDLETSS